MNVLIWKTYSFEARIWKGWRFLLSWLNVRIIFLDLFSSVANTGASKCIWISRLPQNKELKEQIFELTMVPFVWSVAKADKLKSELTVWALTAMTACNRGIFANVVTPFWLFTSEPLFYFDVIKSFQTWIFPIKTAAIKLIYVQSCFSISRIWINRLQNARQSTECGRRLK